MDLSALVPGLVRTWSPMLAGWIISLPLAKPILDAVNLHDTQKVNAAVAGLLGALYYFIVRVLEQKFPQASYLLGHPAKPSYSLASGWSTGELASALSAHALPTDPAAVPATLAADALAAATFVTGTAAPTQNA